MHGRERKLQQILYRYRCGTVRSAHSQGTVRSVLSLSSKYSDSAGQTSQPCQVQWLYMYILSTWGESTVIVPDFAIYVYGSSCHHHFFCLILAPFSSFYLIASARQAGMPRNRLRYSRKEERMRLKKNKLHVRVVVKSWTIRLASVLPTIETCF